MISTGAVQNVQQEKELYLYFGERRMPDTYIGVRRLIKNILAGIKILKLLHRKKKNLLKKEKSII